MKRIRNLFEVFAQPVAIILFVGLLFVIFQNLISSGLSPALSVEKKIKPTEIPVPTSDFKEMRLRRTAGAGIIIYGVEARIRPTAFSQTNTWYERKGNEFIYVFGGAKRSPDGSLDLSEGAVFVDRLSLSREFLSGKETYPTPIKAGPVTIVDANGEQLTLSTQDGHTFIFNVASRKYINPPGFQVDVPAKRGVGNGFIVEDGRSLFSAQLYEFENQWVSVSTEKRTTVYVGRENVANGRGTVLVFETKGEPTLADTPRKFFTSNQSSSLRIFDVIGDQLILASVRGECYTFDMGTNLLTGPILTFKSYDPRLATLEASFQLTSVPGVTIMPNPTASLQPYP